MTQPLVSIIIPTYNRAHLIGETLDSVLAQTYTNWECIVVDDGSTDNTDEVLTTYCDKDARFKYVHRPENHKSGGNGARNYGFEVSKGEYVNWFDSDDLMHSEKLERQMDPLHNSDYNFSVCQTVVFEGSKDNILGLRHEQIVSGNVLNDFITHGFVFLISSPLLRKSFLNQNDIYFDEKLLAAQDWEYFVKVIYYDSVYLIEATPLVYIRKHSKSISLNINSEEREWHYYLAREKIFSFLNKNNSIDILLNRYFKNYFSNSFLIYVKKKNLDKSSRILLKSLHYFHSYVKVLSILLIFCFYMVSNRGYQVLKNLLFEKHGNFINK